MSTARREAQRNEADWPDRVAGKRRVPQTAAPEIIEAKEKTTVPATTTTTTTTTPNADAEALERQAAEATEKAAAIRARAEDARKVAEERRQAEVLAIRRRRLAAYDEVALLSQDREAKAAFARAVIEEQGAAAAFVAWQVAATTRYLLAVEARQAQAIIKPDAAPLPVGGPVERSFAAEVQRVLDGVVANLVEDVRDAMQAELDAAGR